MRPRADAPPGESAGSRRPLPPFLALLLLPLGLLLPGGAAAQEGGSAERPGSFLPAESARWVTDSLVRLEDHPEDGWLEVEVGPVSLEPGLPHYRVPIQVVRWPHEGWLRGYSWAIVDARGDTLPAGALHHLGIIDPGRRHLFSPIAQRLVSAGNETEEQGLPSLVGVPMEEDAPLLVVGMFANPTDRRIEEARLRIRVGYIRSGDALLPRLPVRPFYLDVMGPVGRKSFSVPAGRTARSWEGRPSVDARILGVGGHGHDFTRRLALVDAASGDTLWSVEPEARPDGHLVDVPEALFLWTAGKKIHADRPYRAEVVYENPTDGPAPHGGMGVIAGVAWTDEESWPPLDRQNAAYRADLWNTVTAPARAARRPGGHGPLHGSPPGGVEDTLEWKERLAEDGDPWPEEGLGGDPAAEGAGGESSERTSSGGPGG